MSGKCYGYTIAVKKFSVSECGSYICNNLLPDHGFKLNCSFYASWLVCML